MTDPRIHARRVTVARQLGRRRRRRILVAVVVLAMMAGGWAAVHSPLFGARHVTVTGATEVPVAAVVAAAGLQSSPPLVDLDAATIARKVEKLPWVATAAVSIGWPSSVSIRLTQRVPVAAVPEAAGYAVCDVDGRVLEVVGLRPASLPLVEAAGAGLPGSTLGGAGPTLTSVAAAMPESMVPAVQAVEPSSDGVVLRLDGGVEAIVGSADDLGQKFVSLATVLAHGGLGGVTAIDLRVAASPTLIRQASSPNLAGNVGG